jgi:hypothetical protein
MISLACLWCETSLRPGTAICPECGLQNPAAEPNAAARASSGKGSRRGRRIALSLIVVPVMLSMAYAAHSSVVSVGSPASASVAVVTPSTSLQPPAVYADNLRRSVWMDGVKAVQEVLAQPGYAGFSTSYINVAAGHVVSFCGEVAGTSGYDSGSGAQRFISIFGQAQSTLVEGNDASFDVLWNRVCAPGSSPA